MKRRRINSHCHILLEDIYDPIFVCGDFVVDGTHRVIAAHQLGVDYIKAHVCTEEEDGRTNMPRRPVRTSEYRAKRLNYPKIGDFVLFEDDIWTVTAWRGVLVRIEAVASGEIEELLADNFAPTNIKTWEVE